MAMNRRQLMTASPTPVHIVSLVVQSKPDRMDATIAKITELEGAEVPTSDPSGKLVVLLEHSSEADLFSTITEIEHIKGVISATLVYHQIDDEQG